MRQYQRHRTPASTLACLATLTTLAGAFQRSIITIHVSRQPLAMSAGYFPKREKLGLEDLFKGLVTASHILHYHGILDAYGHISVRSPDNPKTFWMPCNIAPPLLSSPDDLIEYNVEDASPVEKDAKPGYVERFIHSEIYKRFPTINSVVHSHCSDVLPYCVSDVPLKATIHMAGFLGMNWPILCQRI